MKHENVIWEGRFQPIHQGHISYIKLLLENTNHLWIFVVENEVSTNVIGSYKNSPVPEFTKEVDSHHISEKNPLPFWLRYRLVIETLRAELGPDAPITVIGGRRLDLSWSLYDKIFPSNRVFMTPLRDSFEDFKANAWKSLGEEVIRVDVSHLPKISATQVRDALKKGNSVENLLSPTTISLLHEYGYIENN